MERDAGQRQAKDHRRCGNDHDPSSPNDIYVFKREESEQEVGPCDDLAHSSRLIEAYRLEQSGRVIHKSIESAKLLECLKATCDN